MKSVAKKVAVTASAPYGGGVSAAALAKMIADPQSVTHCVGPAYSFYTEIPASDQKAFIKEMHVNPKAAALVARGFAKKAGYALPLSA